jgi:subtilisin family serine protease
VKTQFQQGESLMKTLLLCTLIACVSNLATAQPLDRIDPVLAEKLAPMEDGETIQVIVVMADQVDLNAMDRAFRIARATKAERHLAVITALQQKVQETQGPILQYLGARRATGQVGTFEPMWIVNMVFVKATKHTVMELALRSDVGTIYIDGHLELDWPVDVSPAPDSQPGAAEPNLRAINAHRLWDLGYTGQGTIVMNIDTGVNGSHPALSARWRGNQPGVQWYHAWYDQMASPSQVPVDYGSTKHGSHTMGIMTGVDPVTQDTIGVAPGALWIASPTIDVGFNPHTSYTLRAFQWAADPDSNPSTSNDVPDVISNSYQDPNVSSTQCSGAAGYWAAVDALEAIGTAVVWSAGNAGPSAQSVTPPKNRITTNVNFFAVGNLNTSTSPPWTISSSSSRGPSSCDGVTIKPEVCAPGTSIRSSLAGTTYGLLSGTSMASPHVAGALAVLRSANPAYTCSELKEILLNTAVDYGPVGEDNAYGMGLIDMWAAFQQISVANPRIEGVVTGSGIGDTLTNVRVQNLTMGTTIQTNAQGFFRFVLPQTGVYAIRFDKLGFATRVDTVHALQDSTVYPLNVMLQRLPAPLVSATPASMTFNIVQGDSVTNTLRVDNSGPPQSQLAYSLSINGGVGGLFEDRVGTNASTFSGSSLVRGNRYYAARRTTLKEIKSFHVIGTSTQMRFAVYESSTPTGSFTRIYDGQPVTTGTGTGFFGSGPISVPLDSGKYYLIGAGWQGTVTYYNSTSSTTPVGFGSALAGFTSSYPPPASITISSTTTAFYYGAVVTTSGKFITVSNAAGDTLGGGFGNNHTVSITTAYLDVSGSPYTAEIMVASNDTLTPLMAVPVTVNLTTVSVEEVPEGVPAAFALHQNYPNPFNPSTTILYDLPVQGEVHLEMFDILGRSVKTLVNDVKPAGYHNITLDAGSFASGVYYVRLRSSGFVATRKILLVK